MLGAVRPDHRHALISTAGGTLSLVDLPPVERAHLVDDPPDDVVGVNGGSVVMTVRTHFHSQAGMEQVLAAGAEEGMHMVLSQVDAVLAGTPA